MDKKISKQLVKSILMAISTLPISEAMALQEEARSQKNILNITNELKDDIKRQLMDKDTMGLLKEVSDNLILFAKEDKKLEVKLKEELLKIGYSGNDSVFGYGNDGIILSGWYQIQGNYFCHSACHGACHGSRGWR